jgi:hypothetical protein
MPILLVFFVTLKMKAMLFSETLVTPYKAAWCQTIGFVMKSLIIFTYKHVQIQWPDEAGMTCCATYGERRQAYRTLVKF